MLTHGTLLDWGAGRGCSSVRCVSSTASRRLSLTILFEDRRGGQCFLHRLHVAQMLVNLLFLPALSLTHVSSLWSQELCAQGLTLILATGFTFTRCSLVSGLSV